MKAKEWNEKYQPGQDVILTDDFGIEHETHTTSVAWEIGSGHPVVKVDGRSGGYSLERIRAKQD